MTTTTETCGCALCLYHGNEATGHGPSHNTCDWLVEVASGNPEPDSYADTIAIVPCGVVVQAGEQRRLCAVHAYAMDLPLDEFERISEAHDGRAWS